MRNFKLVWETLVGALLQVHSIVKIKSSAKKKNKEKWSRIRQKAWAIQFVTKKSWTIFNEYNLFGTVLSSWMPTVVFHSTESCLFRNRKGRWYYVLVRILVLAQKCCSTYNTMFGRKACFIVAPYQIFIMHIYHFIVTFPSNNNNHPIYTVPYSHFHINIYIGKHDGLPMVYWYWTQFLCLLLNKNQWHSYWWLGFTGVLVLFALLSMHDKIN